MLACSFNWEKSIKTKVIDGNPHAGRKFALTLLPSDSTDGHTVHFGWVENQQGVQRERPDCKAPEAKRLSGKKSYPSGLPYWWGWLTFLFRRNPGQSYFNSVHEEEPPYPGLRDIAVWAPHGTLIKAMPLPWTGYCTIHCRYQGCVPREATIHPALSYITLGQQGIEGLTPGHTAGMWLQVSRLESSSLSTILIYPSKK